MNKDEQLAASLKKDLEIDTGSSTDPHELEKILAARINTLIDGGFERLVQILYRIDVDEKKVKKILQDNPGEDAGSLIASLIIQRQREKIRTQSLFNQGEKHNSDEERW
ncbi:MAG TPA: hypothetical protein VKR32_14470 [Puia sp.]|nr:hypothetical protein [Puia sp.]